MAKLDWDKLGFEFVETEKMYISHHPIDGEWDSGELVPYGPIQISPAAGVLNYGQGLFEGMKAQTAQDGTIVLFRPVENARRMANGAQRLLMPPFPEERFVKAVKETVAANKEYVPPYGKGSLYIRPVLWGTGAQLGLGPSPEYTFCIFVSPVGPYFKSGLEPIKLEISAEYHRAAPLGTGGIKAIGNYAGALMPAKKIKAKGYNEVIYLDAAHNTNIEEVGTSNFFCVKNGELHTPRLTGSILPGITRDAVIRIAREMMDLTVNERDIPYKEVFNADEVFCTGTATVLAPIGTIAFKGEEHTFNNFEAGPRTVELYNTLTGIQKRERDDVFGWVEVVEV